MSERKVVLCDWWSGTRTRPYQEMLHDPRTDEVVDVYHMLHNLRREAGVKDGDEVVISLRATGRRPFSDRKMRLVKPHTYERDPDTPREET